MQNFQGQQKEEPMEIDPSIQILNRPKRQSNNFRQGNYATQTQERPYFNRPDQQNFSRPNNSFQQTQNGQNFPIKRVHEGTLNQPQNKTMKVTNIQEDYFLEEGQEQTYLI